MNKKIWKRFEELERMIDEIELTKSTKQEKALAGMTMDGLQYKLETVTHIDKKILLQWEMQVEDLLSKVVDNNSVYY